MAAHNAGNNRQQGGVSFGRNIDPLYDLRSPDDDVCGSESDIDQLYMFRYLTEA